MKKLLSILAASAILTTISCKKNNVEPDVTSVSTAYKVFLIESTQSGCSPCGSIGYPAFHETMQNYPYDVTMINLNYSFCNSASGVNELDAFYEFSGTPSSSVNFKTKIEKGGYPSKSLFASYAQQAKVTQAKAGIGITKTISGNSVEIKTKTVFFEDLTGNYNLALYVVENGIMASQTGYATSGPIPHDYVYRGSANGGAFGKTLAKDPKKNQMDDATFSYTLPSNVKMNNVKVVAVIWKVGADGKPTEMINSNIDVN